MIAVLLKVVITEHHVVGTIKGIGMAHIHTRVHNFNTVAIGPDYRVAVPRRQRDSSVIEGENSPGIAGATGRSLSCNAKIIVP